MGEYIVIVGNKLSLRSIEEKDLSQLKTWRNKEHFRKYFREYKELNQHHQTEWFIKYVTKDFNTIMFGIEENDTTALIGVCGLCYINWIHRNADLSIYIGKDDIYIDTKKGGLAWETLDLLFKYAFCQINLHKVWTEIYAFDKDKHQLFEKYGFSKDAILRDNYFYDGKYMDSHIYSILNSEWQGRNI